MDILFIFIQFGVKKGNSSQIKGSFLRIVRDHQEKEGQILIFHDFFKIFASKILKEKGRLGDKGP